MNTQTLQAVQGMMKADHINIGVAILFVIAIILILYVFFTNTKKVLSLVSGSLKDPVTGNWSPKIMSSFAVSLMIVLTHIVWLKASFLNNDFSKLEFMTITDYGYLTAVFSLRTYEKVQASKNNTDDSKPTV